MVTLADLARSENFSVLEEVPGTVWRLVRKDPGKSQQVSQRSVFKFWKLEKEEKTVSNVKKFACWTCGKEFVAADFLWHIRECCNDASSSKTVGI